jgi:hypothetical protein
VTWRYFLDQMMDPVANDNTIELTRQYFVDHVRGRGPHRRRWNSRRCCRLARSPGGPLRCGVGEMQLTVAAQSTQCLMGQVAQVPRMGATSDPDVDLLAVLGMMPAPAKSSPDGPRSGCSESALFALNIPPPSLG